MDKELENLSQAIVEIYSKNIEFLKDNFPKLHNRVDKLSSSIESGEHIEVYTLEYTNGYFDILNHENNGYFYNTNSFDDADERAKVSSFDTNNSLDLLRKNPNTNKLLNSPLYKDVTPIIDHLNHMVNFDEVEFIRIFKMIYIGTGLGLHIQQIDKKFNSLTTLIIEKELEIFRLSLFITDYTIFNEGSRKLFLSVEDNIIERSIVVDDFSVFHKYMNYNIQYNTLLADGKEIKDELIQHYQDNSATDFPYKIILQNLERLVRFVNNKDRFLDVTKMQKELILKGKKVLIVAADPSHDGYIKWLEENQDKFIIIAVDVIVRKLEKYNIIPDIVVSIDPSHLCGEFLTTKDSSFLDNTGILLLSQQAPEAMEVLKDKHYYFSQVIPLIPELGYLGSRPNVGTFSLELSIYLGATEVYVIGSDAAFEQNTGNRYSDGTLETQKFEKIDDDVVDNDSSVSLADIIEVKGNLRDTVKSNRDLLGFKNDYESAMITFNANKELKLTVYNLSDGAYIDGMEPCTKDELIDKIKDEEVKKHNITEQLDNISVIIEKLENEKDIKILNSIIGRIKKFQKIKMTSKDHFLQNKLDVMIWILEQTKLMHSTIHSGFFLEFTSLVDIYINYFLNLKQKDLHKKEEINKLSQMWAKGALVMFKDIKSALSQVKL